MQWGRQFGMVCTSLYLQLKPLEGESFSQTGLWAGGKGEMPSSSPVVPVSTPALYSALNVLFWSGQAPPEEGKLSVLLCSSSARARLGFWGCLCLSTPVSATRKLEQGWSSQVLSPALCPIQVLLVWPQHLGPIFQRLPGHGPCVVSALAMLNLWAVAGSC